MSGSFQKKLTKFRVGISLYVLITIVVGSFGNALILPTQKAEASQVTIDSTAQAAGASHTQTGSQTVFINDQTGYKFYRDSNGSCVYSKTSNGGSSWGGAVTTDAQTDCIGITVWYDQWTPNATGTYIHIVTYDTSADDLWYNRLDTSNDNLLMGTAPVSTVVNSGQGGTLVNGANYAAITKGTDGTIYMTMADASDSYVVECTTNCNATTGWTETGTNPLDLANDYSLLVPLPGGSIMLINRDISLEDIRTKIWNNTTWSASWTFIDTNATDNTTYDVGMAATISSTTPGRVYLAYTADNATLGTDDDVRTAYYNGSTWTNKTDVISNVTTRAITGVAIALDSSTEDVYVGYSARTTAGTAATGNIYWKKATSSMTSWSAEMGPVNASANDMYGIDFNMLNDQRIYATWYANSISTIYGDTIADIFPGIHVSTLGTQTVSTLASTTNVYLGGAFVLTENYKTENVTGITITESGTIDGSTDITNVKLLYEMDNTAPYDCASVSYNGTESAFGSVDTNGFSGADGVSSFTGTSVSVSTTTAMCVYAVVDVLDSAVSSSTIDISINNPSTDISASLLAPGPSTAQNIPGTTLVYNDNATLTHYHWRYDDGSEALATSRTGGVEDTALTALQQSIPRRLRIQVSNQGSSSTPATQYRIESAPTTGACTEATVWTDVGAAGGEFDMYDSTNLLDGANTTNIANGIGGVTDPSGKTFLTPNAGVKDTSSQTANILLSPNQFVELEYSVVASTTATEGNTYCFRVTDRGKPITTYTILPRATIAADVSVTIATSSQIATTTASSSNLYIGSAFVITENSNSRNVTSMTIAENGSIDAQNKLSNIKLYYDLDTSAPYNCAGESYQDGATKYGATDTDGFSSANGTSTFTASVTISTTSTMCVYTVFDVLSTALNGETINILMQNPSVDLVVSGGGSVSPSVSRDMNSSTTVVGPVLTQTHYHWRKDNGSETTAISLSGGTEDTPITYVAQTTPVRLRIEATNLGQISSPSKPFTLEYGTKITTCDAVGSWNTVGSSGGAWNMFNSTNLTDGTNSTNIGISSGGVTDSNVTFLTPNSAIKDTSPSIASTSLSSTQYIEGEFSLKQTTNAGYDTTYCFRLVQNGNALNAYDIYPELTTSPRRDFEVQRGEVTITGTSITLVAGVDYTAPSASTSAFIRITNSHNTGAGNDTGGGNQNANDVTAYILNPSNIMTSVTIAQDSGAVNSTKVFWEIVEFIGVPGSDNEMIVRSQTNVTYGTSATEATGTAVTGIADDSDVVVFITGQMSPDTGRTNYNAVQSTSAWSASTDEPVFTRNDSGGDAVITSYAVVEFIGQNWIVQRSEHTYSVAGNTETEPITAVNSLSHTFIHSQKRISAGSIGLDDFGHEVWLSSIGYVSYLLEPSASAPADHTSVAWVIENTQGTNGEMDVTRSAGVTNGGSEPLTLSVSIGKTLEDITNASIFLNTRSSGTGTAYPRTIGGATIASTTDYIIWRSDTGQPMNYHTEIVEWPTANTSLTQNYYRLYVQNNALKPTDPWPVGGMDLGENTALTQYDEPLGDGELIRIRMSLRVKNATLPTQTRSFKLQYGPLVSTCSAIAEGAWTTLGDEASSTVWRGYNATGTTDGTNLSVDPPTGGDLLLSVSDTAGTFEEKNNSAINPFSVQPSDDVEYDWLIEQNGATAETYYCFRMVNSDGTPIDTYAQYPQIRTSSFTPRSQNWRWYDDESSETPATPLASENVSPTNIANGQGLHLRVTVKEIENIARDDVRFKLQYSEYANFAVAYDVATSTDCTATSTWCYVDGGGVDNAKITTKTLSDVDACVAGVGNGCGTHNESPNQLTGFRHENGAATEYAFTIKSAGPRVNRVYYFRLYGLAQDIPVETNTGESYPSLVTEGASLNFTMSGIASSTVIEGVTLDIDTTPTKINFGTLVNNVQRAGAHRLVIDANGTEGYQIFMYMNGDLLSSNGASIKPITGTNSAPLAWATGCDAGATSCLGYHTSDDTLEGGSTRFSAIDTYAQMSTTSLDEVSYSSQPVTGDTTDVVFKILVRQLQDAGFYEAKIRYVSVPIF